MRMRLQVRAVEMTWRPRPLPSLAPSMIPGRSNIWILAPVGVGGGGGRWGAGDKCVRGGGTTKQGGENGGYVLGLFSGIKLLATQSSACSLPL